MDMNDFLSTRSEVGLPFKRTRMVFNKLDNWCIAISAGTLLWFMGSFNKFIVKSIDGAEYIPLREAYVLLLILFFLSTVIFVFMRGYLYVIEFYDMRLRDLTDMDNRRLPREPNDKHTLSSPEREFMDRVSIKHRKDCAEGIRNEWFVGLRISNIKRIIFGFGGSSMYAKNAPAYLGLLSGTIFYLLGLLVSILYISYFLLYFYDP